MALQRAGIEQGHGQAVDEADIEALGGELTGHLHAPAVELAHRVFPASAQYGQANGGVERWALAVGHTRNGLEAQGRRIMVPQKINHVAPSAVAVDVWRSAVCPDGIPHQMQKLF